MGKFDEIETRIRQAIVECEEASITKGRLEIAYRLIGVIWYELSQLIDQADFNQSVEQQFVEVILKLKPDY